MSATLPDSAPATPAAADDEAPERRVRSAPLILSAPAALLFLALVLTPLFLTALLSFNQFDYATGRTGGFTVEHYLSVLTDEYYLEIFFRTFRISALATAICVVIGVPEAYILSRMGNPWRSVFLLVILAPLLVSVVVRAFGWSMLLGPEGPVNGALIAFTLPAHLGLAWAVDRLARAIPARAGAGSPAGAPDPKAPGRSGALAG